MAEPKHWYIRSALDSGGEVYIEADEIGFTDQRLQAYRNVDGQNHLVLALPNGEWGVVCEAEMIDGKLTPLVKWGGKAEGPGKAAIKAKGRK